MLIISLTSAPGKQKQENLKFKASLDYIKSSLKLQKKLKFRLFSNYTNLFSLFKEFRLNAGATKEEINETILTMRVKYRLTTS